MNTDERLLQAVSFGLALCAIATRQRVDRDAANGITSEAKQEARVISEAVMDEFNRLRYV
jgi:hypothetical protein